MAPVCIRFDISSHRFEILKFAILTTIAYFFDFTPLPILVLQPNQFRLFKFFDNRKKIKFKFSFSCVDGKGGEHRHTNKPRDHTCVVRCIRVVGPIIEERGGRESDKEVSEAKKLIDMPD